MELLTRDEFRNKTFSRDAYHCVMCGDTGQDAHHIIERRLWNNGGYFIENGATLCGSCHIKAEETTISCSEIRLKAGINRVVLPEHLYDDLEYDKWGNIILANGRRIKGELFFDESVQKILTQGDVLHLFDDYVKYPRTHHLPWSNPSKDDRVIKDLNAFIGKEVVVTVKQDGENFNMYQDYCHARSLEPLYGEDRGMVKSIWSSIAHDIPKGWRICAENLYAKHSIHYHNLKSYLQVFSVWDERNNCLSWDETTEWCDLLGLTAVPVLYKGVWDEKLIRDLYQPNYEGDECEGYVVRLADRFNYSQFRHSVGKWVRPNHVTTSNHWRHQQIIANELTRRENNG